MPYPMKVQPIDCNVKGPFRNDPVKPAAKSRFKRLFERQFPSVLRNSSLGEKLGGDDTQYGKEVSTSDLEPSSMCLAKMVQNFIEESNEKQSVAAGRNRCNCFNSNYTDSSDDEFDFIGGFGDSINAASSAEACEILKSIVPCTSISERNLLADIAKMVEKNKICKRKDDCRMIVINGLLSLGYDASICKSRWEKSPSHPAGEYEYIDVIVEGERILVDIDFRSEFEIARSTGLYKSILQSLPSIFVGKPDRLQQIVSTVSEAAKQSLKKKGMPVPPWRKADYIKAKWLSPYTRTTTTSTTTSSNSSNKSNGTKTQPESDDSTNPCSIKTKNFSGGFELISAKKISDSEATDPNKCPSSPSTVSIKEEDHIKVSVSPWQPPEVKPRSSQRSGKIVAGLASVLKEKP